jgi:pimeloyl-ACP methyl ester carboxylesterase
MDVPRTRYAQSADGTYVAFQAFGDGPDLVVVLPWISHLEAMWEIDEMRSWFRSLARFAHVICMDQRGIGLSNRMTQMIDLETRVDDVRAVLDAAGSERPILYGQGLDGGAICAMFAAVHPERTAGLVLWSGQACGTSDADYPWGPTAEESQEFLQLIADTWGDEDLVGPLLASAGIPSKADDAIARKRWARFMRHATSRGDALIH